MHSKLDFDTNLNAKIVFILVIKIERVFTRTLSNNGVNFQASKTGFKKKNEVQNH